MKQAITQLVLIFGILVTINILGSFVYGHLDLTEEKRFTLTEPSKNLLSNLEDPVFIQVLLEGEFPAGFKRLQRSTTELINDFRSVSGFIEYEYIDPNEGTVEEINEFRKKLAEQGLKPVNLRLKEKEGTTEKMIFPYAIVSFKGKSIPVNLLENEIPGVSPEVILNNSISLLEYKFANAIQKAGRSYRQPIILFTEGHGELPALYTQDMENTLAPFYNTGRVNLDSVYSLKPEDVSVLIIAKPLIPFTEKHKFIIDQYIMKGGKVLWLLDKLDVSLDSLYGKKQYLPFELPLKLDDMLFKYGVRIQPNLVLDLQCSRIPQVIGQQGGNPQVELFPYYYHPIAVSKEKHPIVKGLDGIDLRFPSTIDTIRTKVPIKKTILLNSSEYSRYQLAPVTLDFEILRYDPIPEKFNKPFQPLAVLLEGKFPSLYENRVTEGMLAGLEALGESFLSSGAETKMIIVSDGDVIKNLVDPKRKAFKPLGFNQFENHKFANKDFLLNAIEYLIDENGIIKARGKEVKLRLLNSVKAQEEKAKWQLINILIPIVFLILFGIGFNWFRKRKYA